MSVILDLETVAIDSAVAYVEPVSAPANYKKPEAIAAYIAEAEKAQIEKAALYPWTARIVALGSIAHDGTERVDVCQDHDSEAAALTAFWALVDIDPTDHRYGVRPIIGFNSRQFDLPVLLARSLILGVAHPAISLDRYRSPHIDLMERLTWQGAIPARSLKWFARRFGLPVDDAIGGADIAALVAAEDWPSVASHCLSDIRLTRELAIRLGVMRAMVAT